MSDIDIEESAILTIGYVNRLQTRLIGIEQELENSLRTKSHSATIEHAQQANDHIRQLTDDLEKFNINMEAYSKYVDMKTEDLKELKTERG